MSKDTPKIRFSDYKEGWKNCKLSKISSRITRKNKDLESILPLTISAQDGLIDQSKFFNKTVASKDVTGYYLIRKGEFAYNKSYSNGYPWGAVKRLNHYDKGVLSTLYIVFEAKGVDSDFLEKYYDSDYWHNEISKYAAEGARNHGLLNISPNDFFKTELGVPVKLEEQQQIGLFFKKIDDLINVSQRELELLQETKKAFMQKLIPKAGSNIPDLRFEGFVDDWEEKKLKNIAYYRNGKAHENDINAQGRYIVVNSRFVSTDGNVRKYTNIQAEPLFKNEIAFVLSDVPNGRAIARTFLVDKDERYSLNQRIAGIKPLETTHSYFLHILMNRNPYFLKYDDGVKQTNLSKSEVEEWNEFYPKYREQVKIGAFFETLDGTITLHQHQLDSYKELKKGFLQKMFV